jgi:hypothetical protein
VDNRTASLTGVLLSAWPLGGQLPDDQVIGLLLLTLHRNDPCPQSEQLNK